MFVNLLRVLLLFYEANGSLNCVCNNHNNFIRSNLYWIILILFLGRY